MRKLSLIAAALHFLGACSAGTGGAGTSDAPTQGPDSAATPGAPGGSGEATSGEALPDCFGEPRNAEGRCDAVLLAEDLHAQATSVFAVAAAQGTAYVATMAGLVSVPAPGVKTVIAAVPAFDLAVAGDRLAWQSVDTLEVSKLSEPGVFVPLIKANLCCSLGTNGKYVFARESITGRLLRLDPSAATPATTLVGVVPDGPQLDGDDTHAYYFSARTSRHCAVSRVAVDGGTPQLLASLDGESEGAGSALAVSQSTVFFVTRAGLRSVSKAKPAAPALVAAERIEGLVADTDRQAIFWGTTAGSIGRIYRADAEGRNMRLLAELPLQSIAFAVDETALYILDAEQGSLHRLPKR